MTFHVFCLSLGRATASLGLVLASLALSFPGKAIASQPVLVRTALGKLFFDDFNRTSVGSRYTAEGMGINGWSIVNNRLNYTSTSGNGQAYLRPDFSYNGDAIYDFTFKTNSNSLVAPRLAMEKAAGPSGNHYLFDTDRGAAAIVFRVTSGGTTTLLNQPLAYLANVDYRTKIRVGAAGTGTVQVWRDEALLGTGNETDPLGSGNFSFHVGNFNSGGTVDYDNMAVYKSTRLTVNGPYGSWALYRNDGTTPVGTCNRSSTVDYATVTSFPADYAAGSASQIKVFPAGVTTCTGAPAATYTGSPGNEIFGGDVFTFDSTGADIFPPTRSDGQPSGALPVGTTQTTLSLTTDEDATCRYSTEPGVDYRSMRKRFATTGTTTHSTQVTGLTNGTSYNYYVRCVDSRSNTNPDDYPISFNVSAPGFQNQTLITGLNEPTAMAFLPDGRMLITQKGGRIWVVQPGATVVDPTPFLTITNINTAVECGLVSILLDRDFATNGYFYVFYTANNPLLDRISRFFATGNQANPASEVVIWQDDNTTTGTNYHRSGTLSYGPDGYLYVSIGDHNSPGIAQNLTNYYGKVLRLRPDGTVPTDNPFYDGAGPNKDAIWLRGLRNPFRFYIHPVTGEMLIGDVGDNTTEEVNRGVRGANYGWPQCEGTCNVAGMTNPIYSYTHNNINAAVTAGFIYQGSQFPPEYRGNFFFGDYAREWIKRLTFDNQGNVTSVLPFEPPDGSIDPGGPTGNPVFLTEGPDGSLYYVDIGTLANDGTLRRMSYFANNQPPVAVASGNPTSGEVPPLTVNFSSAGSQDPEAQPLTYLWEFGDGNTSLQANPVHTYTSRGQFQVKLTVSDGALSSTSDIFTITVGGPPIPTITSPADGISFTAGNVILFSGTATDHEDGDLPDSAFSWTILFHHDDHVHPALGPLTNVTSGTFRIPSSEHDFRGKTSYEIILTVRDSDNMESVTSVFIYPQKVNLTFDTSPTGLNLEIDGVTKTAPQVYDTLVGFTHLLNAPKQVFDGQTLRFLSWSDNGAQSHPIRVPNTDQAYTATFSQGASLARNISGKLFFDDFNRTSVGSEYTAEGMGTNGWAIVGNRLKYTSTSGNGQAYLRSAFSYNGDAIYDFTFKTNSNSLVAPRLAMEKAVGPSGNHYLFDTDHGAASIVYRVTSGGATTLLNQPSVYPANIDYRTKIRVGAAGTGTVQVWRDEVLLGSGNESAPLGSGNFSFHVGNFNPGGAVDYDNMAVYKSTRLTVNGPYGSWALYRNDGTTPVGTCNRSSTVDYATVTSFPADYAAGSASQIKVFPAGVTTCTGAPAATYTGSPGNEIFGGDGFTFTP